MEQSVFARIITIGNSLTEVLSEKSKLVKVSRYNGSNAVFKPKPDLEAKENFVKIIDKIKNREIHQLMDKLKEQRNGSYPLFEKRYKTLTVDAVKNSIAVDKEELSDSNFNGVEGMYDFENNKIVYIEFYKKISLPHEFLHAISSFYDKYQQVNFSGFYQNSHNNEIGNSLNEGYTEMLNQRYFGNVSGYKTERKVAKLIEELLGQDMMEDLYFKADLLGLVNNLEQYTDDKEDVLILLREFDSCSKTINHPLKYDDTLKTVLNVEKIIYKLYSNKYNIEENNLNERLKDNFCSIISSIPYTGNTEEHQKSIKDMVQKYVIDGQGHKLK